MVTGYKITAVVLFLLAAICLAVAVALYVMWNIRQVHDVLTGKDVQRRIDQLRGATGRWWTMGLKAGSSENSALAEPWDTKEVDKALGFSSLGVADNRHVSDSIVAGGDGDNESGTTLLGDGESGTTLLGGENEETSIALDSSDRNFDTGSKSSARNVGDGEKIGSTHSVKVRAHDDDSELNTTLLGEN